MTSRRDKIKILCVSPPSGSEAYVLNTGPIACLRTAMQALYALDCHCEELNWISERAGFSSMVRVGSRSIWNSTDASNPKLKLLFCTHG